MMMNNGISRLYMTKMIFLIPFISIPFAAKGLGLTKKDLSQLLDSLIKFGMFSKSDNIQ